MIMVICFVSNYFDLGHFGFYEDDYTTITPYLDLPMSRVVDIWLTLIDKTFERGRPLGNLIPSFATIAGYNIAGIPGIHFIGFMIVALNGCLIYKIIKKKYTDDIALFAGIILVLYPAITVKQYLTHTLQLQSSLLIGFVAILLYVNGRTKSSYVVSAICLFTYELGFLPFLFAPLFNPDSNLRERLKELVTHFIYCGVILVTVAGARIFAGDYRFSNPHYINSTSSLTENSLIKSIKALFIGPWVSLSSFFRALKRVYIWGPRNDTIILFGILGSISGFILAIRSCARINKNRGYWNTITDLKLPWIGRSVPVSHGWVTVGNVLFTGIVSLSGAYILNLPKYPPNFLSTRNVSEHLASTFGGSLFVAGLIFLSLYLTIYIKNRYLNILARTLASIIIAVLFGVLVAFGRYLQLDADNVWTVQRAFWTQFVTLVPDIRKGTRIYLYKDKDMPFALNLQPFSWSSSLVIGQLYRMPDQWGTHGPFWYNENSETDTNKMSAYPRLLLVKPDWWKSADLNNAVITVESDKNTWASKLGDVENGNLVILHFKHYRLQRDSENIVTEHGVIHAKKRPDGMKKSVFQRGYLYQYLVDPGLQHMKFPRFILYMMRDEEHRNMKL